MRIRWHKPSASALESLDQGAVNAMPGTKERALSRLLQQVVIPVVEGAETAAESACSCWDSPRRLNTQYSSSTSMPRSRSRVDPVPTAFVTAGN